MTTNQTPFVLHPEHKNLKRGELPPGFRPLPSNLDHHSGCLKVIGLLGVVTLVIVALYMLSEFNLSKRFLEEGLDTTAQVISCKMVYSNKSNKPEVRLSYTVSGFPFYHTKHFTEDCTQYPTGHTLSIVYLSSDPAQIRFGRQPETLRAITDYFLYAFPIVACLAVFTVTGVLGAVYKLFQVEGAFRPWNNRDVVREGRIIKIYREKEDLFVVEYRFKPSPKTSVKGTDAARRPDLIGAELPAYDTPVRVLYTDRNIHRLM